MGALLAPAVVGGTNRPVGWLARWRILWTQEVFQRRGCLKPGDNSVPGGLNRHSPVEGKDFGWYCCVGFCDGNKTWSGLVGDIGRSLTNLFLFPLDDRAIGCWRVPRWSRHRGHSTYGHEVSFLCFWGHSTWAWRVSSVFTLRLCHDVLRWLVSNLTNFFENTATYQLFRCVFFVSVSQPSPACPRITISG